MYHHEPATYDRCGEAQRSEGFFVERLLGRGDEKQDAQDFWRQLLSKVYSVEDPEANVLFESPVKKKVGTTV